MLFIIDIHNATVASKYFPKISKSGKLVFIPKPGKSLSDPFNYRPISLLNIIGKLLEKIIAQRFLHFLEHHNILNDFQFGFRTNRSTHQALHLISNTLNHSNTNKHATYTVVATP